jgi:hypothetical protein
VSDPRNDELVRELRDLEPWLAVPPPPDVRVAVRTRLSASAGRPSRRWPAAAAVVLLALAIALVPQTRAAVANATTAILRFAGIELASGPPTKTLPARPSPLPTTGSVTLQQARQRARFPVGVPTRLGPPERVLVSDPDATGAPRVVSLLYRGGTVRLDELDGTLAPFFAKKLDVGGVVWTDVQGRPALWIPAPHTVVYVDRNGVERSETARLAGATLIWQRAAVTYRLEGHLTLDEALAIARSID